MHIAKWQLLMYQSLQLSLLHALSRNCRPVRCQATQEDQAQQDKAERSSAAQNGSTHQDDEASNNDVATVDLQKYAHLCLPLPASLCTAQVPTLAMLVHSCSMPDVAVQV